MSPGRRLREEIEEGPIMIPGAFNALVGRLIEATGFPAAYLSGAAFSAGSLALPDVGLFTLTELVQHLTYLTRSVEIPIVVDADTGFGEALNVERTIIELEAAGAAAIQLEDQLLPKRCGHLSGKSLTSAEAMCAKIRAAAAARHDPDLVIIARTDARGVHDFEEARRRALMYVEAGADWIFPEALETADEFAAMAQAVPAPLLANMTEFGRSPLLTFDELAELGYKAVLYPVTLLRVAMNVVHASLGILQEEGTQKELLDMMLTRQELYDLLDYTGYEDRDRAYFGRGNEPNARDGAASEAEDLIAADEGDEGDEAGEAGGAEEASGAGRGAASRSRQHREPPEEDVSRQRASPRKRSSPKHDRGKSDPK